MRFIKKLNFKTVGIKGALMLNILFNNLRILK